MTARSVALTRAHLADALTGARFALAPLAAPVVAAGAWRSAAIVVATAWWTDFFDGRIARTTTGTRLGRWDPYADTAVGAGIVIGLAAGRHVPPVPFLAALVLLAAAYVVTGNFAFGQLAQAIGYGPLLWHAAVEDLWALAVLVATIVAVAALDARRFVSYVLPTFFRGVGLSRRR